MRLLIVVTDLAWLFKSKNKNQKIAALPYVPENYPGGDIRIGNWKAPLAENNIEFEVFWASDKEEYEKFIRDGLSIKNYRLHFKILYRRAKLLNKLKNFRTVWVQRGYIPFYPLKKPLFESRLKKAGVCLIVDYYDADYVHNKELVNETARISDGVSVSSPYLFDYFSRINNNTFFLPLTLDSKLYALNKPLPKEIVTIGWMGSPGNSKELIRIKKALIEVEEKYPNVRFEFLCREIINVSLERQLMRNWNEEGFDYYKWLSEIDIGIVPISGYSETSLAKSPMKLLEFLASGIPVVSDSCKAYPKLVSGVNCLFATTDNEWVMMLSKLIDSIELRKKIGNEGDKYFRSTHSYAANVELLIDIFNIKD